MRVATHKRANKQTLETHARTHMHTHYVGTLSIFFILFSIFLHMARVREKDSFLVCK